MLGVYSSGLVRVMCDVPIEVGIEDMSVVSFN